MSAPYPASPVAALRRPLRLLLPLFAVCSALLLSGCATTGTTADDRAPLMAAPTDISELYSQVSLRTQMAFTGENEGACSGDECARRSAFDKRVAVLGARLAAAAYKADPALQERIPQFNFSVLDKTQPGSGSTAGGSVVILRPVGDMALSDEALSFVIGREMGHVIARHHEFNTGTSIAVTVAIGVLVPAVNLARLLAAAVSGSSASAAATGVSNIASFAGSRAITASYWPAQRKAADVQALKLLDEANMNYDRVVSGFAQECLPLEETRWRRELDESITLVTAQQEHRRQLAAIAAATAAAPVEHRELTAAAGEVHTTAAITTLTTLTTLAIPTAPRQPQPAESP